MWGCSFRGASPEVGERPSSAMHTSNPGDSRKQAGASALPVRAPTLQFPMGFLTVQTIAGKKKKAFKTNRNPEIWGYFILRSFLIGFLCVCVCFNRKLVLALEKGTAVGLPLLMRSYFLVGLPWPYHCSSYVLSMQSLSVDVSSLGSI